LVRLYLSVFINDRSRQVKKPYSVNNLISCWPTLLMPTAWQCWWSQKWQPTRRF